MTGSLDRHGRRLVRQRHGRKRQRRVQDRAGVAAQAIRRPGRARIGDVPVGLVVELEASPPVAGLQDIGTDRNRVSCKPSGTSRLTIKGEQKSGHFRQPHRARHAPLRRTRHTPTTTKNLTHENSRSPSTLQFHYKGHITAYARRRAYACTTPATSRTRR